MLSKITNYMQLALEQAFFAVGISRPNPAVGAVIVKDGNVVGMGRTQRPGNAHAEVMALRSAGELARGAAIYVTLEPCCHYGRTPPCTKAIIDSGIKRVFFAHADPNPLVGGKSRKMLENAGIEVYEGVEACILAGVNHSTQLSSTNTSENPDLQSNVFFQDEISEGKSIFKEIERFFEAYDYFVCNKRTFVEVKVAVSEDGFMGRVSQDGFCLPLKITGAGANCWNHELRAMSDAILIGAGTLLSDNPRLDVRYAAGNNPVKILWAGHHEFSFDELRKFHLFETGDLKNHENKNLNNKAEDFLNVIVFSCVPQPAINENQTVILLNGNSFAENWNFMIEKLFLWGMHRLEVEPGATLAREIFASNCSWNRLDLWKSTEVQCTENGLEFPGLPANIIAKESAILETDVLTVYYPT